MLKNAIETSIFIVILCLSVWWCLKTDETPSTYLDLSKQTLVFPKNSYSPSPSFNLESIIYFDVPNSQAQAHASAIVNVSNVSDKDFMLLYFAGSREGARDVGIYQSFFTFERDFKNERQIQSIDSNKIGHWSEPTLLLDAPMLSRLSGKFIKKLGNPITFVDMQGRVHLFVVGVSMGGWATSKIYWLLLESTYQKDGTDSHKQDNQEHNLKSLHYIKELHLSPLLNFSHLVRTPALLKDDGGFILPIYHELAHKYPLLLDFNSSLSLTSILRPTQLKSQLQPSFVPLDKHSSVGIYRNHKAYENTLFVSECSTICADAKPSNLKNYDSSSVLFNALNSIFLLHNQGREQGNRREELWIYKLLTQSLDEQEVHFSPIMRVDMLLNDEVSYPSVAESEDFVHIAYTYGRKYIRTALVPKSLLIESAQSLQKENK